MNNDGRYVVGYKFFYDNDRYTNKYTNFICFT